MGFVSSLVSNLNYRPIEFSATFRRLTDRNEVELVNTPVTARSRDLEVED